MNIERIAAREVKRFRAIRLEALREAPGAFGTALEEAEARSSESWRDQVSTIATFVAKAGERDVGVVRGTRHDEINDAGYLISMWVAPEVRQSGIGAALVDAVIDWARTQELARLFLDVAVENVPATSLYTGKGFIPTGRVGTLPPPREHIREIQMVLNL